MYGLWGYLLKAKALPAINARRVLEGGWYLNQSLYGQVFKLRCSFYYNPHIRLRVPTFFLKSCFLYLRLILWQTVIFAWELARHVIKKCVVDNVINKTPRWWNIARSFTFLRRPWSLTHLTVHDILSPTSPDNIDAAFSARVKIWYRWQPSQE